MRKEKMFKLILVLVTSVLLISMSVNVFAADGDTLDFFEDTTNELDLNTTPETNTNVEENKETETNTTTDTNNENTNLPEAGLAEDTITVVAITLLAITAIYAYKKVNEYKNI